MKPQRRTHMKSVRVLVLHDAQTDMLPGEPGGAICVQRFDDSLSSAIHITYRSWLRSSSMHEPRDPPLEVVLLFFLLTDPTVLRRRILEVLKKFSKTTKQAPCEADRRAPVIRAQTTSSAHLNTDRYKFTVYSANCARQ